MPITGNKIVSHLPPQKLYYFLIQNKHTPYTSKIKSLRIPEGKEGLCKVPKQAIRSVLRKQGALENHQFDPCHLVHRIGNTSQSFSGGVSATKRHPIHPESSMVIHHHGGSI